MFAQVTRFQYWKSEHNQATCEDASADDPELGLFAISDGAGTTLFSNIWARILVAYSLRVPLLSNDPFEVEWWVRQAQEVYRQEAPKIDALDWNALQKAQLQGSHATLATVRLAQVSAIQVQAELLVFGDSCIFIHSTRTNQLLSFPLQQDEEFERAPVCIPSKLSLFQRSFHRALTKHVELESGDTCLLATDAVSRWLVSSGGGRYPHPLAAFEVLQTQTPETWETFIKNIRGRNEMVDDDSTALLITLSSTQSNTLSVPLGSTAEHHPEIRQQRQQAFQQAKQEQNKEAIAITYGDGHDLRLEGVQLSADTLQQARQVADAQQEVLFMLRQDLNSPNLSKVKATWKKHEHLLLHEPCAEKLRQTLLQVGVITPSVALAPKAVSQPITPIPPVPIEATPQTPVLPLLNEVQKQEHGQEELKRGREQLALQQRLTEAILADDDEAIFVAQQAILQSPYLGEIPALSMPIALRVEQAKKRLEMRRFVLQTIRNRAVKEMAQAYTIVQQTSLACEEGEIKRLELAYLFSQAYQTNEDSKIIQAYEQILHSPYHSFFAWTEAEEERVTQAWNAISPPDPLPNARDANASTISDDWFRKVCLLKQLYMRYKLQLQFTADQIERQALIDLHNDQYVQEGIEEANRRSPRRRLDPAALLAKELKKFKSAPGVNYEALLFSYKLTQDEVEAIFLIFLRREAFEDYLQTLHMPLQDWLDIRKHDNSAHHPPADASQSRLGKPKLNWWKGL